MKKQIPLTFIVLFVAYTFIAACGMPPSISKEGQLATIVAGTLTAQPVAFTPIPTLTFASPETVVADTPVVAPGGAYYIYTSAQNVNLRIQPGTFFQVSRVMAQGTRLQALGTSPGGEWAYVQNDEGINGWVGISFVDTFPLEKFPIVEPDDSYLISGHVLDSSGLPISGIGFAIEQIFASKSLRTDSVTDASGVFYAYLPKKFSGVWTVSYVSISSTSNAMTPDCLAGVSACGQPEPASVTVTLPVSAQLNFIWK